MRNFSEALTYVLVNTNIDPKKKDLTFPMVLTDEFMQTTVREMALSERAKNVLGRNKVWTMGDLQKRIDEVEKFRNCGKSTVKEIKSKFMQKWYEMLPEKEVTNFWEEFITVNS